MLPYLTALFVLFWQWNNQRRWGPVFSGRPLRENPGYASDSGWPGLRIFWPRNDLAPLLRWCRHCLKVPRLTFLLASSPWLDAGCIFQTWTSAPTTGRVATARRAVTVVGAATPVTVYLDLPVVIAKRSPTTAHTYLVNTAARAWYPTDFFSEVIRPPDASRKRYYCVLIAFLFIDF